MTNIFRVYGSCWATFTLFIIFMDFLLYAQERFPRVDARLDDFNPPSHLYGFMKKKIEECKRSWVTEQGIWWRNCWGDFHFALKWFKDQRRKVAEIDEESHSLLIPKWLVETFPFIQSAFYVFLYNFWN